MRLAAIFLALAVVVLIPFLIWGDWFERAFTGDALQQWLASYGRAWGWLMGLLLLVADLFLPVPGTAVMSGLGYVYGTWLGGAAAAGGSFLSGALAYGLCRKFGDRVAVRLMGPEGYAQGRRLFEGKSGGFVVAGSRCLPLLPEVVACMAGLTKMAPVKFFTALACGSLPMGFVFAWIGAAGREEPGLALGLSVLIPAVLYGIALLVLKRKRPDPN
ncbi:MAG TPA: VTT domain-containing protein [Verrucomicrobiales bacterium]|jgi:uncharacterized membrane protein YdjX (TVP38/TMEM64 family)|nr:VTT domain-containing protein [Verrucomicrobiales bacterium]